jgi:aspartyl-tRNA(Asn)/glutamyl-tRNA(Gln) amidotransferase subunit B
VLPEYDARVITSQGHAFADYFETVSRQCGDAKAAANWCTNEVLQTLNARKLDIGAFSVSARMLAEFINKVAQFQINKPKAREVFTAMVETREPPEAIIKRLGLDVTLGQGQLTALIHKAVAANPKAVADFRAGKVKAMDALVGAVMRETKGKASTSEVRRLLDEELAKG